MRAIRVAVGAELLSEPLRFAACVFGQRGLFGDRKQGENEGCVRASTGPEETSSWVRARG